MILTVTMLFVMTQYAPKKPTAIQLLLPQSKSQIALACFAYTHFNHRHACCYQTKHY